MPEFIPGMQLNEAYFHEVVKPILDVHFPGLSYSSGLIGYGSDVIGFDTAVSRDHQWGPRLLLFLEPNRFQKSADEINQVLRNHLPNTFRGYSTHYSDPDPEDGGTQVSEIIEVGPVNHLITFHTIENYWQNELGINPLIEPDLVDWLTFQEHKLLSLTAGKLFYDDLGLELIRNKYLYYPYDVWLYLMAAQWSLISQEEAFVGRTAQVGDELGSKVITARLVERLVRICFLMERKYSPYSKWFGSAFKRLRCYPILGDIFNNLLKAEDYRERDKWFAQAYSIVAQMHNNLGITPHLDTNTRTYSGWHKLRSGIDNLPLDDPDNTRPFQVIFGSRFCDAILDQIKDPEVLAFNRNLGSVNQFLVESSEAIQNVQFCRGLKKLLKMPE